jgi:hypothetical protein
VSLCAEDGDSGRVSGRDTLAAVTVAMAGARLGHHDVEDETRLRYEEFVRGKRARKEWKARRDNMLDLCCSGVGRRRSMRADGARPRGGDGIHAPVPHVGARV